MPSTSCRKIDRHRASRFGTFTIYRRNSRRASRFDVEDPRELAMEQSPSPESRVPVACLPWRCCRRASVAGFYFAHPDAKYFNVGRIGPDQLKSWAERSESSLDAAERALAPLL